MVFEWAALSDGGLDVEGEFRRGGFWRQEANFAVTRTARAGTVLDIVAGVEGEFVNHGIFLGAGIVIVDPQRGDIATPLDTANALFCALRGRRPSCRVDGEICRNEAANRPEWKTRD
jgi:hypothetical protein